MKYKIKWMPWVHLVNEPSAKKAKAHFKKLNLDARILRKTNEAIAELMEDEPNPKTSERLGRARRARVAEAPEKSMPSKTKAPISFRIKRSPKTKQFRCVVRNEGNNEIILTGESCKNKKDVLKMIISILSALRDGRVAVIDDTNPKPKPVKFGGPI